MQGIEGIVHFSHRIALIAATVLLGGIVACTVPTNAPKTPSDPAQEAVRELVLKATTLSVNRLTDSEVMIRFEPPNELTISDLRFRLDQDAWYSQKDPSAAWHIKTSRLSLGDHVVEMRAVANGNRPLSGLLYLKVFEEAGQESSWGGGTTSNVRIVI